MSHTYKMNFQKFDQDNFNQYKISKYILFHEIFFLSHQPLLIFLFLKVFWHYILWRDNTFFLALEKIFSQPFLSVKMKPISHDIQFCNITLRRFS